MARPRSEQPTPTELEILQVLWHHGPCTVRQVMEHMSPDPPRAYTTVMTTLNTMTDKWLLERTPQGRFFRYRAAQKREKTLTSAVGDMVTRVYGGSPSALVAHFLEHSNAYPKELAAIRKLLGDRKRLN